MKLRHVAFLLSLLIPSIAQAGIAVSTATGNLSDSTIWATVDKYALPTAYSDATVVSISATPGFSNFFTPSNASDPYYGVVFWGYSAPTSTATMTVNLTSGTVIIATATITMCNNAATTNGPQAGPFLAVFQTQGTYGDTTANQWRYKFYTDGGAVALRAAAASQIAYAQVLGTPKTVSTGDMLIISGRGSVAGTVYTSTVTVDISTNIGSPTFSECLQVGVGGSLVFGNVSSTVTCTSSNIRLFASHPGQYALAMGYEGNPVNSLITNTIYFPNASFAGGIRMNDERSTVYGSNYTPPAMSIYGNPSYNLGGDNNNFVVSLASPVAVSTTVAWISRDIGLRPTGGDLILVSATEGAGGTETRTTTAYDSALRKITVSPAFLNAHSTGTVAQGGYGAQLRVLSSNARIIGGSAVGSLGAYILGYGGSVTGTEARLKLSNVETDQFSYINLTGQLSEDSVIEYMKQRRTSSASSTIGIGGIVGMTYSSGTVQSQSGSYLMLPSAFVRYNNYGFFASNTPNEFRIQGDGSEINDTLFDGYTLGMRANMIKTNNVRISGAAPSTGGFWFVLNSIGGRHTNTVMDLPVTNTIDFNFYNGATNLTMETFINPRYSAATEMQYQTYPAQNSYLNIQNIQNAGINNHKIVKPEGLIESTGAGLTDSTVRTSGSIALKFTSTAPVNSTGDLSFETTFPVGANSTIYMSGFYKMGTFVNTSTPTIRVVTADGSMDDTFSLVSTTTWSPISISGVSGASPTSGTLTITIPAPLTANDVVYFDDLLKTISNSSSGVSVESFGETWSGGVPVFLAYGGGSFDYSTFRSTMWSTYGTDAAHAQAIMDGISISSATIAEAVLNASTTDYMLPGSVGNAIGVPTDNLLH